MGNEASQLSGLEIDEKAVEVTDFWTHHSAVLHGESITPLSVFIGEPLVGGSLWINQTPLEKATKNLMLHRHPCILKYISSWTKGAKLYLAVEYVKPLSHVIANQSTLQICIGLHNILKAVAFLHDKAVASHNNICSACIYVTPDGSWKLGGLEYLCRFQDCSLDYLMKTRAHRYALAIDPIENSPKSNNLDESLKSGSIDKYAFAVLVNEVLRRAENSEIPCLEEFRQYCTQQLQHINAAFRPSFTTVLKHEFFTHNFIVIYSFLTELPLKTEPEKQEFFTGLAPKLRQFPEEIVARQLGELLLSRLVLLDRTAQSQLLPFILVPKQDNLEDDRHIFCESTFKQIIIPKLLHIFRVRDAQIRLLLLSHFKYSMLYFTNEQLQNYILPELLIGIKDTNDHLVSITLIALSDLVPILGAATVIGGKRAKLFNDGRPTVINSNSKSMKRTSRRSSTTTTTQAPNDLDLLPMNPAASYLNQMLELPERPSPDGGEEEISTTELDQSVAAEDDLENWSDWDANELTTINAQIYQQNRTESDLINLVELQENLTLNSTELSTKFPNQLPDITELDIKNQKNQPKPIMNANHDDIDFFQDMEPVIELNHAVFIDKDQTNNKLNVITENQDLEEGWGDDLDWVAN